MSQAIYITTPIYYVNDVPHLGHAYTTVVGDALARFYRSMGRRVFYVTGTDEHGQKIERAAAKRGERPIELADRVVRRFQELWTQLDISHDDFIRTTENRHEAVVQQLWTRLMAAGDIYLGAYEGLYCTGCEAYKTEKELEDGICPDHGTPAEVLKEPSYFFRLERYRERLLAHLEAHPEAILPDARRHKIQADLAAPVSDLSVSRATFSWGVPVPGDDAHVAYVWLDALTNYISVLGWPDGERFAEFWGEDTRVIHLIGKDILWFHTVYWPEFLMSAEIRLPTTVFAHGWWTIEGRKMSKSLGNQVDPGVVADAYGVDALRYFLLREVPLGGDGDFSKASLVGRINADLANDLGNLANRTLAMCGRWCDGKVPATRTDGLVEADAVLARIVDCMESIQPNKALEAIFEYVRSRNRDIDARAPWTAHKEGRVEDRDDALADTLEALRRVAAWIAPFMPGKADELANKLGLDAAERITELGPWGETLRGRAVAAGKPLFPRIEADEAPEIVGAPEPEEPAAEPIPFETFAAVDLRVGLVTAAERVKGADRLLHVQVDIGEPETRSVVAGIAEAYAPEDLLGRHLAVVANLAPRKIRGIPSEAMLLAAGKGKGLTVVTVDREVAPGTPLS